MTANDTGIRPTEYRVLIRLDPVERKTAGGIYIPDATAERNQMAATKATILAVGGNAFEEWRDDPLPKPGDRVLISKFAGKAPETDDLVRICNDKDIIAVLENEAAENVKVGMSASLAA